MNWKWIKLSWYVIISATVLWASGVVQAIVPQIVDAAFRQGPATGSKFALTTGAFTTGNCRQTAADGSEVDSGGPCSNPSAGAAATSSLTLTGALQDIPGATITLSRAGTYLIIGQFEFQVIGTDTGAQLVGTLSGPGTIVKGDSAFEAVPTAGVDQNISAFWIYTASGAADIIKLQGYKVGGTGTSAIAGGAGTQTFIFAVWVSP